MLLLLLMAMLWGGSQTQDSGYELSVPAVVTVQEGLCTFVPCTFVYPNEGWTQYSWMYGYWYKEVPQSISQTILVATNYWSKNVHESTQGRFQLLGKPEDGSCSLLITDVQDRDRGVYYFRVEPRYRVYHNYKNYKLSLEVTARIQKPDVYIMEPLWPGRWVTIICVFNTTFEECPAPTFSWEGAAVSQRATRTSTHMSSVLKFAPRPQEHGTNLTCRVHLGTKGVTMEKTVRLDVAYSPKDPVISVSCAEGTAPQPQGRGSLSLYMQVQKGQFLQLRCEADSLPGPTLSWALENRVLSYSRTQDPKALELVLPSVMERDAGTYICLAENPLGSRNRTIHLTVQYPPESLRVMVSLDNRTVLETSSNATSLPVLQGQSLQLLCVAHSNPPANVSWNRGPLTLSPAQPHQPGLLFLPGIQPDQEGEFTCSAWNQLGSQRASVSILVHYEKRSLSKAFSNGVLVGAGVSALLCLCVMLILVKMLKKKRKEEGAQAERLSRRSTVLDYINVFPRAVPQAQNQETKQSVPQSCAPAPSPQARTHQKQKQQCPVGPGDCPRPTASMQAPQANQDEVLYSTICFRERRTHPEPQDPRDSQKEYAEIRFH